MVKMLDKEQRGKLLFPHCKDKDEIFEECLDALRDPLKSAILKDNRDGIPSTHICVFQNKSSEIIALPIFLKENSIHIFTIKDVKADRKVIEVSDKSAF